MTRVSLCCRVFKPCHSVIPPWPYYQACAFDQCHAPTVDTRCSSLELYAALCASLSVCIDWRGLTAHECRECPLPPPPQSAPSRWAVAISMFEGTDTLGNPWVDLGGQGGLPGGGGLSPGWSAFVSWRDKRGIQVRAPGPRVQGSRAWTGWAVQGTQQVPGPRAPASGAQARPRFSCPLASGVASPFAQLSPALLTRCTGPAARPILPTVT